jgi:Ribosomal protein L6P/L9E
MSRIAKDPVVIPESVTVTADGNNLNFKGPQGRA